ncbi:MAG: HDOD domain-containing protein [Desulfovibrionaceae bacterium]|nr:HDOD domain-containing protein [Desulfovibrionaceae bacterium]
MPDQDKNTNAERLLPLVEKIPAFSQSVSRVLSLASDINCSPKVLVEVVSGDPVLTMKILRLVNSAYFGLPNKITSVHQALVNLGLNTLKHTALSLAMLGVLPRKNDAGLDIDALWLHSLAVGLAARRLAQAKGVPKAESEDYFVAGLLHDVGKLVYASYEPARFARALETAALDQVDLTVPERAELGATHAEVGALLAERWGLAEPLRLALAGHHAPSDETPAMLTDVVFVANQVVKRKNLGFSGNPALTPMPAGVRERLTLTAEAVGAALEELPLELQNARVILQL